MQSSQSSITFLGTGGGRFVMADQSRGTAGFIISVDGEQIHVDPGPATVLRAAQHHVNLHDTTVILVSHEHVDNSNDLNLVIDVMTNGGTEKRGTLITTEKVVDEILTRYHKNALAKLITIKPEKKVKLQKMIVKAIPTKNHGDAIGFVITTPKFILGYTSDTAYFPEMAKYYGKCNILIINNSMPFNKRLKNHMSSDDTVKLLQKIKPSLVILTHFGNSILEANPLYEARAIQKKTGVQVIAAVDGLSIEPTSYSANAKQKNLISFEEASEN
ncbi:MAG: MBL fold metallo-hydrolase [Nanoarchaeota archaeon]|nr:MBL fold metallo-hydrolase [Nanoarchaeota archaeon]